jgi:hypothetical protein
MTRPLTEVGYALDFQSIAFVTVTPLANKDQDIYGYLKISWNPKFKFKDLKRIFGKDEMGPYNWYWTDINLREFTCSASTIQ